MQVVSHALFHNAQSLLHFSKPSRTLSQALWYQPSSYIVYTTPRILHIDSLYIPARITQQRMTPTITA